LHYPLKKVNFVGSENVMAEDLIKISGTKKDVYTHLIPQLEALLDGESDLIANLANVAAALKESFGFFWVGFYLVKNTELVLGPFQGPVACTRIQKGRGVCGQAWANQETLVVPDVDAFPGHIACSSLSKSEIVVPLVKNNTVVAVLDVDSDALNSFDSTDAKYLNEICQILCAYF
jgi:GAF domain-containing protein